ncbi:MAG: long-chain-fatty-acid--CoA ligase [Planctomycetota bacterium]|jgi:long-chain acyl-CoA synthetase
MEARVWHRGYDAGVPPSLDYEPLTVPEAFSRSARKHPERTALVYPGGRMSYGRLADRVERCAGALAERGVGPGSSVAVQLPNLGQTVIAAQAVLSLGARLVMTNPLYTDDELTHQWTDSDCRVAVVADFVWPAARVERMRAALPIEHWIAASIPELMPWPLRPLARWKLLRRDPPRAADLSGVSGMTGFREALLRARPQAMRTPPSLDDVAVLQYTGGTTGRSKGAMLTHRNLSANVQQVHAWTDPGTDTPEVFLAAPPLFHVMGLTACMHHPLWMGATIVLLPDPRDIAAMVRVIEKERVTRLVLVPAMFHAINEFPGVAERNLSSVTSCFSGSAPLADDTLRRFEELTGGRILEGYGLTETSPVTHVNPLRGDRRVGSIGLPVPDTDARVVDASDGVTECATGEAGELLLRGPQVMAGYWNAPEETASALADGWLRTGDLATCDAQGYFRIVGRKKEMIVCGGYNVYPDEVDRVLLEHPDVLEVATIGVPDERLGERVKSFAVRRPGATLSEEELVAYGRQHLAAYKVPREVEWRDALPRSSVLKVLRRVLLEEELERRKRRS